MSLYTAIVLAIVAAAGMYTATAFQKAVAKTLPKLHFPPALKTLGAFFGNPRWLGAFGLSVLAWALYLVACAHAPISMVQPILGLGLAVLALWSVFFLRERLAKGEWLGIAVLGMGIVVLGLSADPGEVRGSESIHFGRLTVWCLFWAGLVLVAWLIERGRPGYFNIELIIGAAGGVFTGIAALLTRVMMLYLKDGQGAVFGLILLLVITANMSAVITSQGGFQRGRAMTITATLAVLNKFIAVVGGFFALGEALPEDPKKQFMRIIALALLIFGTVLLARFSESKKENSEMSVIPQ